MRSLTLVIILATFALQAMATNRSICPDRVEYNLFDISSGHKNSRRNSFSVDGIEFNRISETYIDHGTHFQVDVETYTKAQKRSQAIFQATPGDRYNAYGSAIHVGGNLILTNQHVLSVSRKNTTECKHFSIRLNSAQRNKPLKCKKVHYCNPKVDFCLIEMYPHKKGYALDKAPTVDLKRSPVVSDSEKVMSIGNTQGFGLHAATGFGLEDYHGLFKFYAPVFGGNSGGAIFNDQGEAIGLVRSESALLYGDESYNVAVSFEAIYTILKNALKDRPEVFNQINFIN